MKYIFLIISHTILSTFSINPNPKLCVDCKFFRGELFLGNKFARCSLFPTEEINHDFLVDGSKKNKQIKYGYCSVARQFDDMCGNEGKLYEKKQSRW